MRQYLSILVLALPLAAFAGEDPVAPPPPIIPPIDPGPKGPVSGNDLTFVPPAAHNIVTVPPLDLGASSPATAGAAGILGLSSQQALSDASARRLANRFAQATAFCRSLPQSEYVIDCFAYEYWGIAEELVDDGGAEAAVKELLQQTARDLAAVAQRNRSTSLPPARARQASTDTVTTRPLLPVESAAVDTAAAEADAIISETQTILLRSAENSERRRAQFQRIVASMETGTILLRSL